MTAANAATGTPAAGRTDRHVHEIDIVRILTFACVIGVHTFSGTNVATNPVSNGAEMLLHFTRESFFFLTGFVLMHQYGRRAYDLPRFWRRRMLLVGIPYLTWSVIYTFWRPVVEGHHWATAAPKLGGNLLLGTAWYHLYFLLVSLQIYLIFPLLAWFVRATRRHHVMLLAASALLQVGLLSYLEYGPDFSGWAAGLGRHQDVLIWNYQFWILLGGVAGWHRQAVVAWVVGHRRPIGWLALAGAALALAWYCGALVRGSDPIPAAAVLQPVMVPWSLAAIAGLFAIGTVYGQRRRPGRLARTVSWASDRSFGIFLVHPLVLSALLWVGGHAVQHHVPNPFLSLGSYLVVVAGAIGLTELFRRGRASLMLTGRRQLAHSEHPNPPSRVDQPPIGHEPVPAARQTVPVTPTKGSPDA
ncbi:MAG TPA: acyltransferase [Jatrophihabitans sp.]|nr:acyltransferase [Jatrophihabitans sp.]